MADEILPDCANPPNQTPCQNFRLMSPTTTTHYMENWTRTSTHSHVDVCTCMPTHMHTNPSKHMYIQYAHKHLHMGTWIFTSEAAVQDGCMQ